MTQYLIIKIRQFNYSLKKIWINKSIIIEMHIYVYCTSIIIPFYIVLFYTFQYYLYNCNIKFIHHALYTFPFIVINFCSTPLYKVFAHSSYLINLKIKCWNLRYCSCSVLDFFFYSFYHRWKTLKDVFSCSCRLNANNKIDNLPVIILHCDFKY